MKEMMKQKMMNRFHRRNSSTSSSVDFKSAEKLEFTFSSLQALQVPAGWDKLTLSLISVESDKTVSKTGKASVWNGNCRWTETLSESIWISNGDNSKELQQCLYKLLISKASTRSGILGEVTVNLSNYLSSETSLPVALPLKKCDHGTILQVAIQCLTPRPNLRCKDSNSLTEDVNSEYSDLDNMSNASDGTNTKNVGPSMTNSIFDTSHARGLGSRETSSSTVRSHHSFDSIDESFGRESPSSNLSEVGIDMIGIPESTASQSSTLYSPVNVYDSPRSSRSPFGSGKNILNRRQDSGKASHPVPASPLRTFGPAEFLEAEGSTPEELRAEARMWERNARKLKVDLDLSRNETINQTKNLDNASMELSALRAECNGLQDEIKHLKILLGESEVKERDADTLKVQFQDKTDVLAELEEEIRFQKELNENLSLQLNKTQDSNLELVSVLQELEENIEKQTLEIESLKASQWPTGESNDSMKLELDLQKFQESQRLESTIIYLEKTLEEKSQCLRDNESEWIEKLSLKDKEIFKLEAKLSEALAAEKTLEEKSQSLRDSESEWTEKLSLKDKEIFNLEAKLSEALAAPVVKETESHAIETPDLVKEVEALKEKVLELERDCNELTDENIELLFKLKELSKDFSTNGTSVSSSYGERPSTDSPNIGDSETGWQIKGVGEKMKPGEIAAAYLQIRCHDLESKCLELEVQMESFKDRASHLNSELERYREKAVQQESEIAALNQLLKCQVEEQRATSFDQEEQAADENSVQCGEEDIKLKSKDIYNDMDGSFEDNEDALENLVVELKSKIDDLGKELLAKSSAIDDLTSDCLLKEHEIQSQKVTKRDLETQFSDLQIVNSELEESLKVLQKEVDDTNDKHISSSKILEKKLLEVESHNQELECHLAELEEDNLDLSGRISGLEAQLRYLTDARESSRLEAEHSGSQIVKLQAEVERLENEVETTKVDMRQKVQDMQNRWLESQEECEYLKKANPQLQSTAENLMEECTSLQKSNSELRNQRLELHNRCTVLEAKLRESEDNFLMLSKNLENLEEQLSSTLHGISSKEKKFNSELDGLHLQIKEHTEKCVTGESLLNQMYLEKVVEVENLQKNIEHLNLQISATHDERDRMASEAILEMHVLRADKDKWIKSIAELEEKLGLSEKKLDTVKIEYEKANLELKSELSASRQSHEELVINHEKLMDLLENIRSNEEKLKNTVAELSGNLKSFEYQVVQLTEENSSLKVQLQKIPELQDEIVALKNSLNEMKYEKERLEASLQMISGDYEQLKEEKTSLLQKASSMHKAVIELEDHKHNKIVLEEKLLRLQGDLAAREALYAQDAELKNELGRFKRSNSQLQWKLNRLQEEKKEYTTKSEALEEQRDLKPDDNEIATSTVDLSTVSDTTGSLHEDIKHTEEVEANKVDESSRIKSLEIALAEALESNEMYKVQLKSFLSEGQVRQSDGPVKLEVKDDPINKEYKLEAELNELQERYLNMSLKYAEVEAQREDLVLKLKAVGPGRSWFHKS
uniref:early endosome antigen 1-like n=1 Tax=Erigeron canadensis TaxID=72917 RepID=UPI001CB90568|nr:early endosome antigen 1-like [Erigeron canadensis]